MTINQALDVAVRHHQAGRLAEAESLLRQILAHRPDQPDALHILGIIAHQSGNSEAAIELLRKAISISPRFADYHANLGIVLAAVDRIEEAISAYRAAILLQENHADAHNNLGNAIRRSGRIAEAESEFRRAIALRPQYPEALSNLGNILREQGRLDEAIGALRQALALRPDYAEAWNNLGATYERAGRHSEAMEAYDRALSYRPQYADAQWNKGLALLLNGDFERGWDLYEARRQVLGASVAKGFSQPLWDGSPLNGRRILLHTEQGHGDTIQFVRYALMVAQRGGQVIVQCQPGLRRLLAHLGRFGEIVAVGEALPAFDVQCPLMSLPRIFKTNAATIPADIPYLHADAWVAAQWRQRLSSPKGVRKIGIAWAGSAAHIFDRDRSLALQTLAPLSEVQDVQWISLQKGPAESQVATARNGLDLLDWGAQITDFADTAALVQNLDLVICVDTAIAHLAGAMGKPVWVLLPFAPDWRWMLNRSDSPWYPTLRLFRQPARGDWQTPLRRIVSELHQGA